MRNKYLTKYFILFIIQTIEEQFKRLLKNKEIIYNKFLGELRK
jgi:hypothetical protein